MKNLYVISGVTGMTGNELARQLVRMGHKVIGFDNFFASSLHTVEDIVNNSLFTFYQYDINDNAQMDSLKQEIQKEKGQYGLHCIHKLCCSGTYGTFLSCKSHVYNQCTGNEDVS